MALHDLNAPLSLFACRALASAVATRDCIVAVLGTRSRGDQRGPHAGDGVGGAEQWRIVDRPQRRRLQRSQMVRCDIRIGRQE